MNNPVFQYFSKSCRENTSFIEIENNKEYFTLKLTYVYDNSRSVLLRMRNSSEEILEKFKTSILYKIIFFPRKSCRCEVM